MPHIVYLNANVPSGGGTDQHRCCSHRVFSGEGARPKRQCDIVVTFSACVALVEAASLSAGFRLLTSPTVTGARGTAWRCTYQRTPRTTRTT
eukprot:9442531-Pyramimonas_sp.AAC.1